MSKQGRSKRAGEVGDEPVAPPPPIDPSAVYTYAQAAALLQMGTRPLRELVYAGRIGHVELNETTWRVLGRHLLDYLARNERPAIRR